MNAKELGIIQATLESQGNLIKQQADKISNMEQWEKRYLDRIAELEKQTKRCDPICQPSVCDCIKKPLTDEEIEQCFADACTDFKLLENGKTKGIVNLIDVGRAIEERHGIK